MESCKKELGKLMNALSYHSGVHLKEVVRRDNDMNNNRLVIDLTIYRWLLSNSKYVNLNLMELIKETIINFNELYIKE